jgi:hypothetical protein
MIIPEKTAQYRKTFRQRQAREVAYLDAWF